jgi:hypothetical protein
MTNPAPPRDSVIHRILFSWGKHVRAMVWTVIGIVEVFAIVL